LPEGVGERLDRRVEERGGKKRMVALRARELTKKGGPF